MPNRSTDPLFQLIKSLEKSEKRNFKLYATRNTASEDLKIVQLFDALDKMKQYDEEDNHAPHRQSGAGRRARRLGGSHF